MSTHTIVLVHGAWCGGWYWRPISDHLREQGFEVCVIDRLPSATGDPTLGLVADTAFLREVVDALPGTAIIVGHSYGGMVISQLAGDPTVAAAVYLTAFLPKDGQSFVDAAGGKLARWIEIDESTGLTRIAQSAAPKIVTPHMNETDSAEALAQLASQSLLSFDEPSADAQWGDTPVTYIVCNEDRVIPEQVQRAMAARAPELTITEIASGHFPMFTAASETAEAIGRVARGVSQRL